MNRGLFFRFCLAAFCAHGIYAAPESILIHSLFFHRDPLHYSPMAMEQLVLYASGGKPTLYSVDEHAVSSGAMARRVYRIDSVCVDDGVMQRFPLVSDHGYTVVAQLVGKSLELIVTYDRTRFAVGVSSFTTIGNQAGVAFHICPVREVGFRPKHIKRSKMVVLDCGHGGKDTGAVAASGIAEKEVALAMGLKLKKVLQANGITVIMTRTSDRDLGLDERTSLANKYDADLFISLHANHALSKDASGIETWHVPHALNIIHKNSDSKAMPYIRSVIEHRSACSQVPARYVHKELMEGVKKHATCVVDRSIKSAISQVLLGCRMPALLVELGFLSNVVESKRLMNDMYQDIQAKSICAGIVDYFAYLDKLDK